VPTVTTKVEPKTDSKSDAKKPSIKGEKAEKGERTREPVVQLEFLEAVDSRTAKKGQVVPLKVVEGVSVDGTLRFRKDAPASGLIEGVDPPGRFGKRARIRMRLEWAKDVNGAQIPLQSYSTGHRFELGAGGASLGGALLLGPVGLLGGALIKGGHITIKKGTRVQSKALLPDRKPAPGLENNAH
jgi:hypothetical protein